MPLLTIITLVTITLTSANAFAWGFFKSKEDSIEEPPKPPVQKIETGVGTIDMRWSNDYSISQWSYLQKPDESSGEQELKEGVLRGSRCLRIASDEIASLQNDHELKQKMKKAWVRLQISIDKVRLNRTKPEPKPPFVLNDCGDKYSENGFAHFDQQTLAYRKRCRDEREAARNSEPYVRYLREYEEWKKLPQVEEQAVSVTFLKQPVSTYRPEENYSEELAWKRVVHLESKKPTNCSELKSQIHRAIAEFNAHYDKNSRDSGNDGSGGPANGSKPAVQ